MFIDFSNTGGGVGPEGPMGPQGPQGPVGPQGPRGEKVKLQKKDYSITQNGTTAIAPDPEFDGIFTGDINVDVQPNLQVKSQTITGNGQAIITPDAEYQGLSQVNVTVDVSATGSSLDITGTGWETEPYFPVDLSRSASLNDDIEYTRQKFSEWDPNGTSLSDEYANDTKLIYAPKIDTSKVTNMTSCFSDCSNLVSVPQLDTSKVTNMFLCFNGCSSLTSIPMLDTSKVTNMNMCFFGCSSLTSIPMLDTSAVTNMSNCFDGCSKLTNFGGFTGLKVSTTLYNPWHKQSFTYQSLLNVIAGLATVTDSPKLTLGSTNLAKLTEEEKAVATNKGWVLA